MAKFTKLEKQFAAISAVMIGLACLFNGMDAAERSKVVEILKQVAPQKPQRRRPAELDDADRKNKVT